MQQVLNRQPTGGDIGYGQMQFIGGANQAQLRADWAYGTEAQNDIGYYYGRELNRAPTAAELSAEQANLNAGGTQGQLQSTLGWSVEAGGKIWNIYEQVLNRPATQAEISSWQTGLANGSQTLASVQSYEAYTGEAQGDLGWWYQVVLGRPIDSWGLPHFEAELASGENQAQVRLELSQTAEAASRIGGLFWQVLNRAPTAGETSWWQGQLATTAMMSGVGPALSVSAEAAGDVYAIFEQVLNRDPQASGYAWGEAGLASGWTQAVLRSNAAYSPEAQADINAIYETSLSRSADPAGLATQEAALAAGQNQGQIRAALSHSAEEAADVASLYSGFFGRSPSSDEVIGVESALSTAWGFHTLFTLGGLENAKPITFATASASTLLNELYVYITGNSGVTPTLIDPSGQTTTFANATQLAAFLFEEAAQFGQVTPVLESIYSGVINWLAQTDQPMLQAGEAELNAARAAQAGGNAGLAQADEVTAQVEFDAAALPAQRGGWALTQAAAWAQAAENAVAGGNLVYATFDETATRMYLAFATTPAPDAGQSRLLTAAQQFIAEGQAGGAAGDVNRVNLCAAGADLCLQEIAEPAGARVLGVERIYQSGDVTLDVAVDPNAGDPYGSATFHSKDQDGGVTGLLEPLLTAVLDIAAAVPGPQQAVLVPAAVAVNAAEAVQQFAQGNALVGLLDLGSAVGFGLKFAGYVALATDVSAATAAVGGASGIAGAAQSGDPLGILTGVLEVTGGVASGLISLGQVAPADVSEIQSIITGLGVAGGVTAGADAIEHGQVADGLLAGLGPLLSLVAQAASQDTTAEINDPNTPPDSDPEDIGAAQGSQRGPVPTEDAGRVAKDGYIGVNHECVALVRALLGLPSAAANWTDGAALTPDNVAELPPGTGVATFTDDTYMNSRQTSHAAIFLYGTTDSSGNPGIEVLDQWDHQPAGTRFIPFDAPASSGIVNNASNYAIIRLRQ